MKIETDCNLCYISTMKKTFLPFFITTLLLIASLGAREIDAVDVLPELEDTSGSVEISPTDIRVDTFRASGAGGQHINKTDSAVRITHLSTGLVVQSQNSRSQGANKETALKLLKSRLILLQKEQFTDQLNALRSHSQIAWGNQIRSYVVHPYSMVKDHRTECETSDVQGVLDGELDPFIQAALHLSTPTKGNSL